MRGVQRGRALREPVAARFERAIAERRAGAPRHEPRRVAALFARALAKRDLQVLRTPRDVAAGAGLPWDGHRVAVMAPAPGSGRAARCSLPEARPPSTAG
ncbi:hypothetical protein JR065_16140 [Xanthomonas sp. AmX2]|uniref:hypothetical protein n=1 Tax=Xanthomonas sp. TaxID=29446 RepID=UPI00198178F4|nr:hypothetical protein [Xanthomonas sp.]MBN6151878.1 hypothetical protein [Xanthomonas sp.]